MLEDDFLRVRPDFGLPEFSAGQYVVLALPGSRARVEYAEPEEPPADSDKLIKRAYSIASSSLQGEYLEFYVALVHSGALLLVRLEHFLHCLRQGRWRIGTWSEVLRLLKFCVYRTQQEPAAISIADAVVCGER